MFTFLLTYLLTLFDGKFAEVFTHNFVFAFLNEVYEYIDGSRANIV